MARCAVRARANRNCGQRSSALRHRLVYAKPGLPRFEFGPAGPGLLAGRNPLAGKDVQELLDNGVSAVLDLRKEIEWTKPKVYGREAVAAIEWCGITRLNLAIVDGGPPREEDLDTAWEFLQRHTSQGADSRQRVFVHCRAGLERTGAVLVAFVARREGLEYETALDRIRESGWWVRPLGAQRRAVERWLAATAES